MNALNRLYYAHKPLRLYNLNQDSLVSCELAAYAAGFELIDRLLDEIKQNAFTATATGEGLVLWEHLFGISANPDEKPEQRQSLLCGKLAVTPNHYTAKGMLASLAAAGVKAKITEDIQGRTIKIDCSELTYKTVNIDDILPDIKAMLPAHLDYQLDFGLADWNMLDSIDFDFNCFDSKDFKWQAFDIEGYYIFANKEE
ncbi:MAG TPA: hypothetical protein DCP97_00455 [Ruminococcaceae bacterium]|nr:hypothetical protein [Oscillospiraceae bacterium]